jgi:hypothetical protein
MDIFQLHHLCSAFISLLFSPQTQNVFFFFLVINTKTDMMKYQETQEIQGIKNQGIAFTCIPN